MTRKGLCGVGGFGQFHGMSEQTPSYGAATPFEVLVNHFESNNFRFHADPASQAVQFFISGAPEPARGGCGLGVTGA